MLPFSQRRLCEDTVVRTFTQDVDEEELKWHRDAEDRVVRPVCETDWMLQMDNELPKRICGEIKIPAGVYHRVIKGTGDLRVEVKMLR
jgi:hypothetical protein